MDKIEKALKRLNEKERSRIKDILVRLQSGNLEGLDTKKLKGREDIFRVKKGAIRIMYQLKNKKISILAIERRTESTYKF